VNVLVIGGSGGVGDGFVRGFCARPAISRVTATHWQTTPGFTHPKLTWQQVNPCDEHQLAGLLATLQAPLDYLINAVGVLHDAQGQPEKTIQRLDPEFFLHNVQVNTLPTLLLAKHAGPLLKTSPAAVFATVSARVGSIAENHLGGWYSYRSSKAALNMALKTLSIEWGRTMPNVNVAALHPGTVDTPLSAPFQAGVGTKKLFTSAHSAACMLAVIDQLNAENSGRFWSWDGTQLPW
jgi:NAD(P)-dependent dehydrogenase (short-subunit alcohol dehydrogenase family)